jgi:hypothetical protein
MKEPNLVSFTLGIMVGILITSFIIVPPLYKESSRLRSQAVSAGVARFNPQTSKFEFIQQVLKTPIPGEKNLTQVEDLL